MVKSRSRSLLGKKERRKRIAGGGGRKMVSGKGERGGESRWRGGREEEIGGHILAVTVRCLLYCYRC